MCASSSSATSGFLRHRAVNSVRSVAPCQPGASPLSVRRRVSPRAAGFRNSSFAIPDCGARTSISASRVGISSGVSFTTSTSGSRPRHARSNQLSSTVLPVPRGPVRTTSCGGDVPPSRSARHRFNTACSRSRPVRAGGVAPVPGVNRRCRVAFMSTDNVTRTSHQRQRMPSSPKFAGQFTITS